MSILPSKLSAIIPRKARMSTQRALQQFSHTLLKKVSGGKENALLWTYGQFELTPFFVIQGYLQGKYPLPNMNDGRIIEWLDPQQRGILPIQDFKVRGDLKRFLKSEKTRPEEARLSIQINSQFEQTIKNCAKPRGTKSKTWLTPDFIKMAVELHHAGHAHSVEAYYQGELVGGVIGIAINGYFVTLSLFHTMDNASKFAFYHLLLKLKEDKFLLHFCGTTDSWFSQFGMVNIEREAFRKCLMTAVTAPVVFSKPAEPALLA